MTEQTPPPKQRRIRLSEDALPQEMRETIERIRQFRETLFALTPTTWMTPLLVGLNVAVFVAMLVGGAGLFSPGNEHLLKWGANYGPATFQGEWWRLLTSTFIHVGLLHLAINMYALWALGRFVEQLVGNVGFLILYLLSGLLGSLVSITWKIDVLSAGASGAIFGVFGALLGFTLLRRDTIPPEILKNLRNNGFFFLGINLLLGFSFPMIDMAAHIGGLVAGFLGGMVLSQPLRMEALQKRLGRNLLLLASGSVLLIGGVRFAPRQGAQTYAFLQQIEETDEQVAKMMSRAEEGLLKGNISVKEFAGLLEKKVLKRWKEVQRTANKIGPDDPPKKLRFRVQKLKEYLGLRVQYVELRLKITRSSPKILDGSQQAALQKISKKITQLVDQLNRDLHKQVQRRSRASDLSDFADKLKRQKSSSKNSVRTPSPRR